MKNMFRADASPNLVIAGFSLKASVKGLNPWSSMNLLILFTASSLFPSHSINTYLTSISSKKLYAHDNAVASVISMSSLMKTFFVFTRGMRSSMHMVLTITFCIPEALKKLPNCSRCDAPTLLLE